MSLIYAESGSGNCQKAFESNWTIILTATIFEMADTLLDLVLPLTMIFIQLSDYYGHLTLGMINDTRKSLKCAT